MKGLSIVRKFNLSLAFVSHITWTSSSGLKELLFSHADCEAGKTEHLLGTEILGTGRNG